MNKRKLHHELKKITVFKPWYLVVLAVIFFSVGVLGLRQNSLELTRLRQEVSRADAQNQDVEAALRNLRVFIYSHMNTNLSSGDFAIKPPIQLKYRYERLASTEAKRVKAENIEVKKVGETVCAKKFPGGGFNSPRVSCITDYVLDNAVKEKEIPSELYKFDFVSTPWSFDQAGLGLLSGAIVFFLFLTRLAVGWWYKHEL